MKEQHRVLVATGEEWLLRAIEKCFRSYGYSIDCSRQVPAVTSSVFKKRHSALLLDLRLLWAQGSDGLEMLPRIRRQSPETPVVLFTYEKTAARQGKKQRPTGTGIPELDRIALRYVGRVA